jgi:hypothetical protein
LVSSLTTVIHPNDYSIAGQKMQARLLQAEGDRGPPDPLHPQENWQMIVAI